jgi:hypothetical protein
MNINNRPLGGVVRGVCYSGFREGQHPDRGSGAVNPSYEQTLEDLRIIAKSDFGIIRVYDSGSNSRMVLSIIREERRRGSQNPRCMPRCGLPRKSNRNSIVANDDNYALAA